MLERTEISIVVGALITSDADVGVAAVSQRRQVDMVNDVVDVVVGVDKLLVAQVLGFWKPGGESEVRRLPYNAKVS